MQDFLLKSRCMPSGRCLVPVIGDDHQNKDFFLSKEILYLSVSLNRLGFRSVIFHRRFIVSCHFHQPKI